MLLHAAVVSKPYASSGSAGSSNACVPAETEDGLDPKHLLTTKRVLALPQWPGEQEHRRDHQTPATQTFHQYITKL